MSPPERLDVSLNEVEALAQKAARGAGFSWGVAEDAGRSAAWLARRLDDWAGSLAALLESPPSRGPASLLLAAYFADSVAGGEPRTFEFVASPIWLLPGVFGARPVVLRLGEAEIRCNSGEPPSATHAIEAVATLPPVPVALAFPLAPMPPLPHRFVERFSRSLVTLADWRRLDRLAQRTYVPASDRSRRLGAGAGLDDA
jgi:hypothetical protein